MIQNLSLCIFQISQISPRLGRPNTSSSVKLDIFIENKGFRELKLTLKGEKHKEKEMYLIKSWNSNQVFNMLIENEPIDFIKASQMTDETGDFTFRARERIRTHPLVKPVWEKINRKWSFQLEIFKGNLENL